MVKGSVLFLSRIYVLLGKRGIVSAIVEFHPAKQARFCSRYLFFYVRFITSLLIFLKIPTVYLWNRLAAIPKNIAR